MQLLTLMTIAFVDKRFALGQDFGEGLHGLQRRLQARYPLIVPDAFQFNHTTLSQDSLKLAATLYGKAGGLEPHRPLIFVNSTRPLWMCLAPKTGCTAWQSFVLYVNLNISVLHQLEEFQFNSYNPLLAAELKARDSVWIVRNPYVRFLSSYLDWQARNSKRNATAVSFDAFFNMYKAQQFKGWIYLPSHVKPVSDVCRLGVFKPDVFLRIEQMDLWYDTFMNHYGLDLFEARHQAEHGSLFYKPSLSSTASVAAHLAKTLGSATWSGEATRTGHERHSSNSLFVYYTSALARNVFDLQRRDFESFGYPAWDGNPASFTYI
jgi:hypothetical protein